MSRLIKTYKGHDIAYNEVTENWEYGAIVNPSLKKVIAAVEAEHKGDYPAREVFVHFVAASRGMFVRGTMTSVLHGERECWVTYEGGRRAKESISNIYAATEENETRVDEINVLRAAIISLGDDIDAQVNQMERIVL